MSPAIPRRSPLADTASVSIPSLADPSFSPHRHASDTLLRCLPTLPARDADTALAALDAAEADIRAQCDRVRDKEGAARDQLRRALQASARTRAAAAFDADEAEEARAAAAVAGKAAVRSLAQLASPLRVARAERAEFADARDLVGVLTEDRALDVVRSAHVLSRARGVLAGGEAAVLFDGDVSALRVARARIQDHVDDLAALLAESVVFAAEEEDSAAVRVCISAGAKLGAPVEARIVQAAVDAIVAPADAVDASRGSSVLFSSTRHDRAATDGDVAPGVDSAVARALTPLLVVSDDAIESAREFSTIAMSWFPDPAGACLLAVERLVERLVARAAGAVLDEFDQNVDEAQRDAAEAESDFARRRAGDAAAATNAHRACLDAASRLAAARTNLLDALAAVANTVAVAEVELGAVASSHGVSPACCSAAARRATSDLQPRLAAFFDLEKGGLEEHVRLAFADVARLEAQSADFPDESYHRFRVMYLRVASALPVMTHEAVKCCLASLRRCAVALVPPAASEPSVSLHGSSLAGGKAADRLGPDRLQGGGLGAAEAGLDAGEAPGAAMNALCHALTAEFLSRAGALLEGAHRLLPNGASAAGHPDLWASGSSPLASFCKAVKYVQESATLVDHFLMSFEALPPSNDRNGRAVARPPPAAAAAESGADRKIASAMPASARLSLRAALRGGLEPLTACAQRGIEASVNAIGDRLDVVLGGATYAGDGAGPVGDQFRYHAEVEPSMPFVTACAFLEQQLGVVRSALPPHNLALTVDLLSARTYDVVLSRWLRKGAGAVGVGSGLQMAADGRAVVQAFGGAAPADCGLDVLPALGALFSTPAAELGAMVEARPLARADAPALVALLSMRPDAGAAEVAALCAALSASRVEVGGARDPADCGAL
jgi:hypothetical protein